MSESPQGLTMDPTLLLSSDSVCDASNYEIEYGASCAMNAGGVLQIECLAAFVGAKVVPKESYETPTCLGRRRPSHG